MADNLKNEGKIFLDDARRQRLINSIQSFMEERGLTETKLARGCNLPQPTVHRLLSGETADPRLSTLLQLVDFFDISFDELLNGKSISRSPLIKTVPIISWTDAIRAKNVVSSLTLANWEQWTTIEGILNDSTYALLSKVNMQPRFPQNSLLIIDPEEKPQDGDLVIIHFKGSDEATVREIIIDGPNKQLKSILNLQSENIVFHPEEQKIVGIVIQVRYNTKVLALKDIKDFKEK